MIIQKLLVSEGFKVMSKANGYGYDNWLYPRHWISDILAVSTDEANIRSQPYICMKYHLSCMLLFKPLACYVYPHPDAVRFVCISDTHNQAARLLPTIPDGDVLIHGGDFTNVGSLKEIKQFNDFMGKSGIRSPFFPFTDHTRFVCISDTFSRTSHMAKIPDGDILIHAGNFSNIGLPREVIAFNEFLGK